MSNPTDTNQASEDDLRKKIDVILAANMPIHPEHQIDKRNIINNLIPLIRTEKLKLLAEVRERVVGKSSEQELRVLEAKATIAENIAEITYRLRVYVDEGHANKTKIAMDALNASVKAWTEAEL